MQLPLPKGFQSVRLLLIVLLGASIAACSHGAMPLPQDETPIPTFGAHPNALHLAPFYDFQGGRFGSTSAAPGGGFGFGGVIGEPAKALFGVTAQGGDLNCGQGGCGVVYAIEQSGSKRTEKLLHVFHGPDGAMPSASLVEDRRGILYGTTLQGGRFNFGTVFSLTPAKSGYKEHVLYSFHGTSDGGSPIASVMLGPGGTIFGTAQYYGSGNSGIAFELVPAGRGYSERVLYPFSGGADGGFPASALIAGPGGVLFGTTNGGGSGSGTVFSLTPSGPSTYTEQVIYAFNGSDGRNPDNANLIRDASGTLYGTTPFGGTSDNGVVFKLTPGSPYYSEQLLHQFPTFDQGTHPFTAVVLRNGVLYGTAGTGGYAVTCDAAFDGCGTIFAMSTSGSNFTVIHRFSGRKDGGLPFSPMILGRGGALYGTTLIGGNAGFGTIYRIAF